jgi:mono/diheme cytochrome c family protein
MASRGDNSLLKGLVIALLVGIVPLVAVGVLAYALSTSSAGGTVTVTVGSTTGSGATVSDPHVAAGAYDFVQFACGQCHGPQGQGGVSPYVPALSTVGKTLSPARLKFIIDHGLGVSADPKRPYMPVWGAIISEQQAADLVAYLRAGLPAVSGAEARPVPTGAAPAVTGSVLYQNYGCGNCHGPNGVGGVPNPAAPDRTVPPLSGKAFRKQFDTDAKIAAVIESGSVIGHAPIVSMPHWGGVIPKQNIDALIAYIHTFR